MPDPLLHYYERALSDHRTLFQEFAAKYPKIAGRLQLEAGKCEDPHVERLIQAVAFEGARIQHKLDSEFPEITNALLSILYPHYLAPLPSLSIAQFVTDPQQGQLTSGYVLERGALIYSPPVRGTQCRFQTCYPVTLWPIEVTSARVEPADQAPLGLKAMSVIRLGLECQGGVAFRDLSLTHLRLYLHGESYLTHTVYELLLNHTCHVRLRSPKNPNRHKPIILSSDCLRPVGFDPHEGLLPYSARSFMGYRLLQEYFTFPQKFLFVDLWGLDQLSQTGMGENLEVLIFLDTMPHFERTLSASLFRLGCTPIVNAFPKMAEPIRIDHRQAEYGVVPDERVPGAYEVYSIDTVSCESPQSSRVREVKPFYSIQHAGLDEPHEAFWYASRRSSLRKGDEGTDMFVSFVDLHFDPRVPATDTLTLHLTCTNRDLPDKLPFDEQSGHFEIEEPAPLSGIRCLVKPTPTVRPPLGGEAQWRLISHLSLNYLSLIQEGPEAFHEILQLYDFLGSPVVRQHISGITKMTTQRVVRRPLSMPWNGYCRGQEVTLQFDEEKFVGSGVFLFASVLERFLGLYTSINSFTQLVATTRQRKEPFKRWPPRAGEHVLL